MNIGSGAKISKAFAVFLCFALLHSQIAFALPVGIEIQEGTVTYEQPNDQTLIINASDRAIINFESFNIAANETVQFIQPLASSSVLGRVTGSSISEIFGSLFANGEFILVNPNGIQIADSANINVGSMIAATLDIQNQFYLNNQLTFEKTGTNFGSIFNEADISVPDGGHIVMLAETIQNTGSLTANLGSVVLGIGEKATISMDQYGLINLVIDEGVREELAQDSPLISNTGELHASGGKVELNARTFNDTMNVLINNQGVVEANAMVENNGVIEIVATGAIAASGDISAQGGRISFEALGESTVGNINEAANISFQAEGEGQAAYSLNEGSAVNTTGNLEIGENTDVNASDADIRVEGDWVNLGAFNGENSTVELAGSGVSRILGNSDFHHFTSITPSKVLEFEAGSTQTIDGTFKIQGAYAQHVRLLSTEEGQQWNVNPTGPIDISYAWVMDSVNLSGEEIVMSQSTNRGNSIGWDPILYWNGAAGGIWSTGSNWDNGGGAAPGAGDDVVFNNSVDNAGEGGCDVFTCANTDSTVDASFGGTIGSLTIYGESALFQDDDGYLKTITLNRSLTITNSSGRSGDFLIESGIFTVGANDLTVTGTLTMFGGLGLGDSNGTFNGGSGSITLGALNIDGSAPDFTSTSGTLLATGSVDLTPGLGSFTHNSGTIEIRANTDGATASLDATGLTLYNLVFNKTAGTESTINPAPSGTVNFTVANNLTIQNNTSNTLNIANGNNAGTINVQGNMSMPTTASTGATDFLSVGGTLTFNLSGATSSLDFDDAGAAFATNLKFSGTGTQTFDQDAASGTFNGTLAIDKSSGLVQLANAFHSTGTPTLTITNGIFDLNGKDYTATSTTFSNAGTVLLEGGESITGLSNDTNSGLIEYDGTGSYTTALAMGNSYYNLTFSGNGGIWEPNGAVTVGSGAADATLTIGTGAIFDIDGQNLTFSNSAAFSNAGTLRLQGGETITSMTNDTNSGTVTYDGTSSYLTSLAAGNSYYNLTFSGNGGIWEPNGTVTVGSGAVGATLTIGTGAIFDIDSQNLTFSNSAAFSNAGTLRLTGSETLTSFTNDTDSGTVAYDGTSSYLTSLAAGNSYYNLTFSGNGGIWEPNGTVTVGSGAVGASLTIGTGAIFDIDGQNLTFSNSAAFSNAGTLRLAGSETITSMTNDTDSGTVTYDGTGTYASLAAGSNYNNLTISGSGSFTAAAAVDVNSIFTQSAGTFVAPSSTMNVGDDFLVSGGTFTHNSGDVIFDTAATATIDAPAGGLTFWDFTSTTAGKTLSFSAGDTFTIASPSTWTITGAAGNLITLDRSGGAGTDQWTVNPAGASLSYISITNSNNTSGTFLNPANSTDAGNNTGWFGSNSTTTTTTDTSTIPDPNPPSTDEPPSDSISTVSDDAGGETDSDSGSSMGPNANSGSNTDSNSGPNNISRPNTSSPLSKEESEESGGGEVTYVFVEEGTVNVDGDLVFPGEKIRVDKTGKILEVRAIYVTNVDGLLVFRAKNNQVLKKLNWKESPAAISASSNGKSVYAVMRDSKKISILKTDTFEKSGEIRGMGEGASYMVLSRDGKLAYVVNSYENQIQVVDLGTNKIIKTLRTGAMPTQLVLTKDGGHVYVANWLDRTVSKINTVTGEEEGNFEAGDSPYGLALSGNEEELYVTNAARGEVLIFETKNFTKTGEIAVGKSPSFLQVDRNGKTLFVSNRSSHSISMVDLETRKEIAQIKVGKRPAEIMLTPEGDKAYVANELSGSVSLLDLTQKKVIENIPVGTAPRHITLSTPERYSSKQ